MNKLTDRMSKNQNQKTLNIESMERNEMGEITQLNVKEYRADGEVEMEGTPLNAKALSKAFKSLIKLYHESDENKVSFDYENLSLPLVVKESFELPHEGYGFTTITWEKVSGTGITIDDNMAVVEQTLSIQETILKATITSNNVSQEKTFTIKISRREKTQMEMLEEDARLLLLPSMIKADLTLPEYGITNRSNITWILRTDGPTPVALLSGYTLRVTRPEENVTVTLVARISLENTSLEKSIDIIIEGTNTHFSPLNYSTRMAQIKGSNNIETFNVTSSNSNGLYLTKETEFSDELDIRFKNNGTTNVEVTIVEKDKLNSTIDIGSVDLEFTLKVYLNDDRNVLLGTLPCVVKYYFTTTSPID